MRLSIEKASKTYPGTVTAVDDVSFAVAAGELVALLGESGCGKTTTLKMINRLIEPSAGRILLDGTDVATIDPAVLRRMMGYAFQGVGLFPHMTVAENIGVTPKLLQWGAQRITSRVDELLDLVHLPPEEFRNRYPRELSGGQQQRVGFARALAAGPSVILLDEPFGALDPLTRDRLQQDFRDIHNRLTLTTVLVTHDMTEALLLADRIIVMKAGKIVQEGAPDALMNHPADPYVEELISTPKRQADQLENLVQASGAAQ